jgi:hypothetical protein
MLDRSTTTLRRFWRKVVDRSDSSVIATFIITLIPLLGLISAAVDHSRASDIRPGLHAAPDPALFASTRDRSTN